MTTQNNDHDPGSVTSRTAVGAGWLIAWRLFTRVIGLLSTLVLAWVLVPADFGLVAMATAFSVAIEMLSALGLQDALVRRQERDRDLYDTAYTMQVLRALLTGAVIAVAAAGAATWFSEPRLQPILFILAGLTAFAGFENIGIIEFRRSLRFDMDFRLQFVPRLCQFVITIAAALLLRSYWALIIGIAVAKTMRVPMTFIYHPYRPWIAMGRWRELLGYSFWVWAAGMAALVWERADAFILGPIVGPAGLGIFLLAVEIAVLPITELVAPASVALFAGFSAVRHKGTEPVEMALEVASTLLLIVLPLTIGVSATSGHIVAGLLGPKWLSAGPLIAIFAWMCAFTPFSYVATAVLTAEGKVTRNFVVRLVSGAFKVAVVTIAARTGDLRWVAAAGVLCVMVEAGLFIAQLHGIGNARLRRALGPYARILASGAVACGTLWGSGLGWSEVTWTGMTALFVGIPVGCLGIGVFAGVQWAVWKMLGAPDGPESRLLGLARNALRPVLDRLRFRPA